MNDVELQIALATLTEKVDSGLRSVDRRFDDQQERSQQRHVENISRLERIEAEVRRTNGRVTRAEEQIKTIFRALATKAKTAAHEAAEEISERTGITRRDVYMLGVGGGGIMALWKLIEYAVQHLPRAVS